MRSMNERIREHLDEQGVKYSAAASKCGISYKRFLRLLNGRAPLVVDEYELICRKGLGVSPAYFFDSKVLESKTELVTTST